MAERVGFEPTVDSRPQRFSSSMEFVLSGPSGVILCCPVQGFISSCTSSAVVFVQFCQHRVNNNL